MPDAPYLFASRILVVDDVPADARLVEAILRSAGYTDVAVANDPRGVGELHRRHRYDLVILDLVMPGRNGYEVMADIAAVEAQARLPVLVMTAQSDELQAAISAGARDFVAKPIRALELRARVRNLLEIQLALKALEWRGVELARELDARSTSLRESEELFRLFAENIPEGVWIRDTAEKAFRYVSPRLPAVLGRPLKAGAPLAAAFDAIHPGDHERAAAAMARAVLGGQDLELRLVHPDGSERQARVRTFPIGGEGGAPEWIGGILEDVTERRRMEIELRQAESRFRALVEQSIAGIYIVEDGVWTYVNPRLCDLLGYERDELVGRATIDFVVPEDHERLQQNRVRALAGDLGALSATYRLRRKDGATVHLGVDARYIDVDGRPIFLGIAQDLTDRVRAQEMLREAEEHYRALVEQSLVGIFITDKDGLIYANRRLRDLLGYSDSELERLNVTEILLKEDHPLIEMIASRRRAGERDAISIACRVRAAKGDLLHLEVESKIIDLAGRRATLGMVQDVTDRKRAADALRESEEKYRVLWETSSDVVILMGQDMRIQYANASMARVFGYAPEEVQGRSISVLQPEHLREAHRRGMERYLRTGERTLDWRATEATGLRRDGQEFPLEIAFSELTIGGSSVFAAFMRDITERKRAQAALETANRRLKVLSDRVLAVQEEERRFISSELHDDVGQSLLALQLGMHRLGESSGSAASRLLEECVQILSGVQEKLRQLSVRLHPPQLAQLGLQEAVAALVSRQRATTGLDIRCSCEGPERGVLTPELETAAYRICQEALSNATRHSGARRVEIRTKLEADRFCLSVSDDGRGFDAAVRGEAASEAGHMGLISMEERARLAGGSLELLTAPGAGTVVIAMFPRSDARHAAAVAASP